MLKILRKKGVVKKVIWVIVVFIIIAFGFGGTVYLLRRNRPDLYAGKAFGKKIPLKDFEKVFQQVSIQAMIRYGKNIRQIRSFLNLEAETWDRIILLHEAKRRKIKVDNKEIIDTIAQYPFFQREGKFDPTLYENVLRYVFQVKPRAFEESVRESLKIQKLFLQQTASVTLSEQQVFDAYKKQNEKTQISFVFIDPRKFINNTTSTDEETKTFYQNYKSEFIKPASINVEYVFFPFSSQNENTSEISEQKKTAVKQQADALFEKARNTPDFRNLEKENNISVQTSGFFSMEQPKLSLGWNYDTLDYLFSLKPGDVAPPFATKSGFYVVKLKEKKDSYIPDYKDIKEEAVLKLKESKSFDIARQKSEEIRATLTQQYEQSKLKDFAKIAKDMNLDIFQTPLFNRGEYLPKIGISQEFQEAAFALSQDDRISPVVSAGKGFCILHLDGYLAADQKKFKKEKKAFEEQLLAKMKTKVFSEFLSRIRMKSNLEDNMEEIREKYQ